MRPIVIEQNNATGIVSYWQGRDHQSEADQSGISLAAYIHAIYDFVRQAGAKKVLMIGGAGGTLATMLTRAGVDVTVVDINPAAFEMARRYFCLPDSVACHVDDGVRFLSRHAARHDAIVLDAFTDDKIPKVFWTKAFFTLAKRRLRPGGIFVSNLIVRDDDDDTPDRFCALMAGAWRDVRLLDTDGYLHRNAVAIAGAVRGMRPPRLRMKPARRARAIAAELKGLEFRELR